MTKIFKNEDEILNSDYKKAREVALQTLERGILSSQPKRSIRNNVSVSMAKLHMFGKELDLSKFKDVWILGAGKASYQMAEEIESVLGERITGGKIVTKYGHGGKDLKNIDLIEAGHPLPDENSLKAGKEILRLGEKAGKKDLVINLISGGGSALLCSPVDGIKLEEMKETTDLLVSCGASIDEINSVRKHISRIKGGKLALAIHPAKTISLIVSDVVGDDLGVISSGPTAPDESTFEDARRALERYSLTEKVPSSIIENLSKEKNRETLQKEDFADLDVTNLIISSNDTATEAAAERGREMGFNTLILSRMIEGESKEVGTVIGGIVRDVVRSDTPLEPPCLLISGGETTVTINGAKGEGGPNQEFVLGTAQKISGMENVVIAGVDTDGTDGPTDVAGGIVDGTTSERLEDKGLEIEEVLRTHDAKSALESINNALVTGPTGTNVNDLRVAVIL